MGLILNILIGCLFKAKHNIIRGLVITDYYSYKRSVSTASKSLLGNLKIKRSKFLADNVKLSRTAKISLEEEAEIFLGSNVSFGPRCLLSASSTKVEIGENTSFFSDCLISGSISIGRNCLFAKNVSVMSSSHEIDGKISIRQNDLDYIKMYGGVKHKAVVIGDDCWLGNNVVVLPGVVIGNGTVVGANSVVTKSFPALSVIAGNPAKFIAERVIEE